MRIAADVVIGQNVLPHRIAVVAAEPVAPIVAAAAVLRLAGLRVERAVVGADAEIAAAQVDRRAGLDAT